MADACADLVKTLLVVIARLLAQAPRKTQALSKQ